MWFVMEISVTIGKSALVFMAVLFVSLFVACDGKSDEGLLKRAQDAYNHVDGSESGWRESYNYTTPSFQAQCSQDEYVETIMAMAFLTIGLGVEFKVEVLSAVESGNVGTVFTRLLFKNGSSSDEIENTENWILVDGTWWNATLDDKTNFFWTSPLLECEY